MSISQIQEELKTQVLLLKQEKEEDLRQYRIKMSGTSLKERRKTGVCWYPVDLTKTRFDAGERLIIKVSRQREHQDSHLFQSGKLVSLFSSTSGDHSDEAISGVVNSVTKTDMHITVNADELPQWVHHGQLGIQLLFDENAYREMEKALSKVLKSHDERIDHLKHVLLGEKEASFDDQESIRDIGLNDSQNDALRLVKNAQDVAIIHGPPGTGKTTTLVQTIVETLQTERQVLVCAPSNAAVDLLAERLGEQKVEVLRIGHPARVHEDILSKTMDAKIAQHDDFKNLKDLRKQSEEYFRLASKYKRNFGHSEKTQRRALKSEALRLKDDANNLEYYISHDIISKTQVIVCTPVGSCNSHIKGLTFETVFIDEAAQALEASCWIPILKAQRVILAGDHCQLPPTIKSFTAAKKGLEVTLFEKAIQRNHADVMLSIQYRMNEKIMKFSGDVFYKGGLEAYEWVKDWKVFDEDEVLEFIDTAGCGFYEAVDKETRSTYNEEEAGILMKHLSAYLEQLVTMESLNKLETVGVISPYKAQTLLLNEKLEQLGLEEELRKKVQINTVDSFQGQERDVIYISLVRSNEKGEIGFLSDIRRMNVAMTRARKKLVVIGDSATIGQNDFYQKFLDYVQGIDAYKSAYEFMA